MARRRRWPLSPLRPALGADSGEHIARRDRSISDDVNTRCSSPHDLALAIGFSRVDSIASIIMTRAFFCLAKTDLTGHVMSPGERAAAATWYSSGWNK